MATIKINNKKIIIRKMGKGDLKNANKFLEYINLLIDEKAMLLLNTKQTLKDEKNFVERTIKGVNAKKQVCLIAEHNGRIVGITDINLMHYAKNHIGNFGISIRKEYRGIGLGRFLMSEILKSAKKELKPKPRIIELQVYTINKPAISLYKKLGFKTVAKIPKGIQHKGKLVDEFIMQKYL